MKQTARSNRFRTSLFVSMLAATAALVVVTVLIVGAAPASEGDTTTLRSDQQRSSSPPSSSGPVLEAAAGATTMASESRAAGEPDEVSSIPGQPEVLSTQEAADLASAILASAGARISGLAELSIVSAKEYRYPGQPLVHVDLAVGESMPTVAIGIQKNISREQFSSSVVGALPALPSEKMQVSGCVDGIFQDIEGTYQTLLLLADGTVVNVASIGYGPDRPAPLGAAETKELARMVAIEFAPRVRLDVADEL